MPVKLLRQFLLALFLIIAAMPQVWAQKRDSVAKATVDTNSNLHSGDTTAHKAKLKIWQHPYPYPQFAMLCSVVVPGLGQFYNKAYWKLPIVYVGIGTFVYFAVTDQQQYRIYYDALASAYNPNTTNPLNKIYTPDNLVYIMNYYSRYRNLCWIGAGFIYLLQVIDANVDAQLHSFDVSDNISFHFAPQFNTDPMSGRYTIQPGFSLVKRF